MFPKTVTSSFSGKVVSLFHLYLILGKKSIDTKKKKIGPEFGCKAVFNEPLQMKNTRVPYDADSGKFLKKEVIFGVYNHEDRNKCIGQFTFDLAYYTNLGKPKQEKVQL